jgi:hypothetical protein
MIVGLKMAKIQGSGGRIDKCKIAILNIDSFLNWIILSLRNIEVLNFASPKWVFMLKSVEKWLCKTWKYKIVVGGHLELLLHYEVMKKSYFYHIFLWIVVFKSKVSNDFDENLLNNETSVSGGHLEFLRHFQVLFLKIHILFFIWSRTKICHWII